MNVLLLQAVLLLAALPLGLAQVPAQLAPECTNLASGLNARFNNDAGSGWRAVSSSGDLWPTDQFGSKVGLGPRVHSVHCVHSDVHVVPVQRLLCDLSALFCDLVRAC